MFYGVVWPTIITDYRLQITDYRLQITDYRLQITDYSVLGQILLQGGDVYEEDEGLLVQEEAFAL